eukprot:CAMPEP_0119529744 /NCGR_PEP_ID=MMETSP1344-20130328/43680_1 /TAXON_ID=236787 /ORGANISM="Florenciella parvula, Strain CCMP2471" /LENGTH=1138 /DNA_ID=CAMNT_0007569453 /DNA_START=289 /DNA_END=3705 /DNA_ORIENTATION=+
MTKPKSQQTKSKAGAKTDGKAKSDGKSSSSSKKSSKKTEAPKAVVEVKGTWTPDEDAILERAQAELGNKWTEIANLIPGRSANAVKNRWRSSTRKNMPDGGKGSGIDGSGEFDDGQFGDFDSDARMVVDDESGLGGDTGMVRSRSGSIVGTGGGGGGASSVGGGSGGGNGVSRIPAHPQSVVRGKGGKGLFRDSQDGEAAATNGKVPVVVLRKRKAEGSHTPTGGVREDGGFDLHVDKRSMRSRGSQELLLDDNGGGGGHTGHSRNHLRPSNAIGASPDAVLARGGTTTLQLMRSEALRAPLLVMPSASDLEECRELEEPEHLDNLVSRFIEDLDTEKSGYGVASVLASGGSGELDLHLDGGVDESKDAGASTPPLMMQSRVFLFGAAGSGKSTLMDALVGPETEPASPEVDACRVRDMVSVETEPGSVVTAAEEAETTAASPRSWQTQQQTFAWPSGAGKRGDKGADAGREASSDVARTAKAGSGSASTSPTKAVVDGVTAEALRAANGDGGEGKEGFTDDLASRVAHHLKYGSPASSPSPATSVGGSGGSSPRTSYAASISRSSSEENSDTSDNSDHDNEIGVEAAAGVPIVGLRGFNDALSTVSEGGVTSDEESVDELTTATTATATSTSTSTVRRWHQTNGSDGSEEWHQYMNETEDWHPPAHLGQTDDYADSPAKLCSTGTPASMSGASARDIFSGPTPAAYHARQHSPSLELSSYTKHQHARVLEFSEASVRHGLHEVVAGGQAASLSLVCFNLAEACAEVKADASTTSGGGFGFARAVCDWVKLAAGVSSATLLVGTHSDLLELDGASKVAAKAKVAAVNGALTVALSKAGLLGQIWSGGAGVDGGATADSNRSVNIFPVGNAVSAISTPASTHPNSPAKASCPAVSGSAASPSSPTTIAQPPAGSASTLSLGHRTRARSSPSARKKRGQSPSPADSHAALSIARPASPFRPSLAMSALGDAIWDAAYQQPSARRTMPLRSFRLLEELRAQRVPVLAWQTALVVSLDHGVVDEDEFNGIVKFLCEAGELVCLAPDGSAVASGTAASAAFVVIDLSWIFAKVAALEQAKTGGEAGLEPTRKVGGSGTGKRGGSSGGGCSGRPAKKGKFEAGASLATDRAALNALLGQSLLAM